MAEVFKNKRVVFSEGEQRKFIGKAADKLKIPLSDLADLIGISARTLTDWKREKFLMPLYAVELIAKKAKIKKPANIKIRDAYWYVYKGAKLGGSAVYKKYGKVGGDEEYRKKKWKEWWEKEGKLKQNSITVPIPIKKPVNSVELAEFTGIILGDGGISKNQVVITLHYKDDKDYAKFVVKLIKKLFNVSPAVYLRREYSVNEIKVSRVELVRFCNERLGIKIGNKIKQQIDIPDWITKNKKFQISCVRGLVDTDGSIFTHRYKSGRKIYSYKKLDFGSASAPLRNSVCRIMNDLGINARIAKNRTVRIDSVDAVNKYFAIIGSSNQKHLKRYKSLIIKE